MILDCQSYETALESVAAIIRQRPDQLAQQLLDINYEEWPDDPPTQLWRQIVGRDYHFEGSYWFHLSRALEPHAFRVQGILPLNEAVEHIWNMLAELLGDSLSQEDKKRLRSSIDRCGHSGNLYNMKVNNRIHWGPFAMLVRETAFCPNDMGNHDYLSVPEIIEDICVCINHRFHIDVLPRFRETSHRCIIKFVAPPRDDLLPTALMFLWCRIHGEALGLNSNTCFDSGGERIIPERIVSIEVDPA